MLTLLLGPDWVSNRQEIMRRIASQVHDQKTQAVFIVPELISHDTERRLCAAAGDTCSRFAEVLTFTRLARRVSDAAGHGAQECLDGGGRVVAMASAARQLRGKLKAYGALETKPEFLTGLVDAVDEFKRCCISSQNLRDAAALTEGAFSQKLEELSLLLDGYDALCARGKRDPRDQMSWVLEQLEDCSFAQDHIFYIDGFPDFTRQHMAILEHMVKCSSHVVVSLTCDEPNSKKLAFEKAGETASEFIRAAERNDVAWEIQHVDPRPCSISSITSQIFQGKLHKTPEISENLHIFQTDTVYEECVSAANYIMRSVQKGSRFRDISIACADIGTYRHILPAVFRRYHIPCYISGTEDILEKPVISTVLFALDAALGGFEQQDVFYYLKSMLSPLDLSVCDQIENYAIMWNITRNKWLQKWTFHPEGLEKENTDKSQSLLEQLNSARFLAMEPLKKLSDGFRKSVNLREQVEALYDFLEDIHLAERLSLLANQMEESGDNRNAQILNQLWEILLSALEQLYDVLGDTTWEDETFTRLLRLLLSQYDVGTIPPVLDTVTVGPISAMRCQQAKTVMILGTLEGAFPGYAGSAGVLTDQERVALRNMGVPLTGGSIDGLQAEFAEIYGVFCGAENEIYISCPAGQPSFIYNRIAVLANEDKTENKDVGLAGWNRKAAAALLVRNECKDHADALGLGEEYQWFEKRKQYALGTISREGIEKLYGHRLSLSASQIDKQAECRMCYFLQYGMRAKERKPISVDPAEFGTYVHAVLEETGRDVMNMGGFRNVTLSQVQEIASEHSRQYAKKRFSEIDSERLTYLFQRNTHELAMVIEELWEELQESAFAPVDFEVGFGDGEHMDSIPIPGETMDAKLRGFVDRVDAWKQNGCTYFRVVDYKTGKKSFDYCDVFNGIGLQMLLYLFALEQAGQNLLGEHPIPAGVQYFPARAPYISEDGILSEDEAKITRQKEWKRSGLILNDHQVLQAMEPGDHPVRTGYKYKKDDTITGDVADRDQFRMLKKHVFLVLQKLVDDIASGCVEPNPYTRGSNFDACAFCPYGDICHRETVDGRRNFKTMKDTAFWEEVEKELKNNG